MSEQRDQRILTLIQEGFNNTQVAEQVGVSEFTVRQVRKRHGLPPSQARKGRHAPPIADSETHRADGSSDYVLSSTTAWGYNDFREFIRSKGQDPDKVTFTWGVTTNPTGGYWNKLNNVRPKPGAQDVDRGDIDRFVKDWRPTITYTTDRTPQSLIVVATDFQLGKVDFHGGSKETIDQVLNSFAEAAKIAVESRPQEIVIVDAGDIIENIYSTTGQLATNDLSLPWQVYAAMRTMLAGIKMLAPLTPSLKYVAVSSNHGQHRIGQKQPGGDVHADYGLVVAQILGEAFTLNPEAFGHVEVLTPAPLMESLAFTTSGSHIGVVHGHQAGSPDKLGEWWKGQSHGRMPTADARILISGHWHSLRVQQSGDARWILIGPASDRGSSWFTNVKGESSVSGMLTFLTRDNDWSDLKIV